MSASIQSESRADETKKTFGRLTAAFSAVATYDHNWRPGSEERAAAYAIKTLALHRDPAFQAILADFDREYRAAVQCPDFIPEQPEAWDGMNLKRIAETFAGLRPASAKVAAAAIRLAR